MEGSRILLRAAARQRAVPGIWIGTSGWHYDSWRGPFFPKGLPAKDHLRFYAEHFLALAPGYLPAILGGGTVLDLDPDQL